jgi:hypothetical protein
VTTATLPAVEPSILGPTWQRATDGDYWLPELGPYVLPRFTLGWHIIAWQKRWLQHANGKPWLDTREQFRFKLWWYALSPEDFIFEFRDGVLQRLKGWGKDPVGATLCATEFVGPSRPTGEIAEPGNEWGIPPGQPLGAPHPEAWVQTAAVSKDQTRNTMTLFPGLFTKPALAEFEIDLGKEIIYAHHGQQRIEAVTSSPRALEGARTTFVLRNETHHWLSNNEGHEMDAVIERNSTKSADGAARALSITNAYEPSEDSVAQRAREAYEAAAAGHSLTSGILYDSLEAPPDAPLSAEAAPSVIRAIRGDSHWLNTDRIVASILDTRNPPSRSRRFWYNQITAAEDAWTDPKDFDLCEDKTRRVEPGEEIGLFFDGSKSDDATGLVGCRISDGHVLTLGMWQAPPAARRGEWLAPRDRVDEKVDEIFERYEVVAFFGDPSHTREDETQERYWDALMDDWHRRYGHQLQVHAVPGKQGHAVMWDMVSPARTEQFTAAAERCVTEIEDHTLTHDGDGRLVAHTRNARRYPNRYGVSLWKGHRESARKVDLAVCMVGARMVRRLVLNSRPQEKPKTYEAVFA